MTPREPKGQKEIRAWIERSLEYSARMVARGLSIDLNKQQIGPAVVRFRRHDLRLANRRRRARKGW